MDPIWQSPASKGICKQAQDLKNAGLVAGQVQLQTQRQRAIAAENDYEKAKLQLARAIGLPVGQPITLTDKIPYAAMPIPPLEAVLPKAFESRSDYLAAKSRVEATQASQRAGNGSLLPSLHFDADYGAIGQTLDSAHSTYSVAATVRIPVFEGGRATARRLETGSALRQREAELAGAAAGVNGVVRAAVPDPRSDLPAPASADPVDEAPARQRANASALSGERWDSYEWRNASICSARVVTFATRMAGTDSCMTRRTAAATAGGGTLVRRAKCDAMRPSWKALRYTVRGGAS